MKKLIAIAAVTMMMVTLLIPNEASARPWYLSIRIGFFAKWSIVLGDCKPGWGICLSLSDGTNQGEAGYDNETDKFYIKIHKSDPGAKQMSQGTLEIKEDSPVDPKVTTKFQNLTDRNKTITIKAGNYPVFTEGDYFIAAVDYYAR